MSPTQATARLSAPDAVDSGERRIFMSYDDWLRWPEAESRQTEWVDGEVIVFVPPAVPHQHLLWFLGTLLGLFVRRRQLGTLLLAPFEMRLGRVSREPDILFVAERHAERLTPQRLIGAADLAIEIISPDSVQRDRRVKLAEYAAARIPEYWLIDSRPGADGADFLTLTDGVYEALPVDPLSRVRSRVLPGFWLDPEWLRRDPLPDPLDCLGAIAPEAFPGGPRPQSESG